VSSIALRLRLQNLDGRKGRPWAAIGGVLRETSGQVSAAPTSLGVPENPPIESAPRLLNRNFVLLSQAQLVSQAGNQAFTIALMFWTATTMHSATMTGLMMMAAVLPVVILGPLAGTLADRLGSRLRIVVTCDLLSGVIVLSLALGFLSGPGAWRPALLFTAALLVGVCNAFFDPAVNALTPDLVPRDQIEAANAFQQSARQITVLVSQGLGGMLFALVGPAALFLLDGVSFLVAAATEMLIRPPRLAEPVLRDADCGLRNAESQIRSVDSGQRAPRRATSFFGDAVEGFRYVAAQPGMIGFLVAAAVFNALLMPITVLLPVYVTTYLHADVRWYGFLLAAISAGALTGCTLAGTMRLSGPSRRSLMITAYVALALALGVLGQIQSRWVALAIAFATGVLAGIINVLVVSIVQRRAAGEFRGRVMGLHATMIRVLVPIGMVGGGAIADLTGRNVPLVYAICGGTLALTSVILLAARPTTRAFLALS
jgi:DHA3 family macrolide efflux protein-like MFS transporter